MERNGHVVVSAPLRTSMKRIKDFIKVKEDWLLAAVDKAEENFILTHPETFSAGEEIWILGEGLKLQIKMDLKNHVEATDTSLVVYTPYTKDKKLVAELYQKWFKKEVDKVFAARLKAVLPSAEVHGIKYPGKISARKMKSRYGTCTGDDRIFLNSSLLMVDSRLIDYVIAHELCHIREKNHSPRYYKLLTQVMPDWKERRMELHKIVFG